MNLLSSNESVEITRARTDTRVDAAVAVYDVSNAQHSLLIKLMFGTLRQLGVILHPQDFGPKHKCTRDMKYLKNKN